jgi:hypothetical protein
MRFNLNFPVRLLSCCSLGTGLEFEKDRVMSAHDTVEYAVADGNDYPAHEKTYESFITLVKWGTGTVILIVALMAYFLV